MTNPFTVEVKGTPPVQAPIPDPGIYWLKRAKATHISSAEGIAIGWTWGTYVTEWVIGEVQHDGCYFMLGCDEDIEWASGVHRIVLVGPRLSVPPNHAAVEVNRGVRPIVLLVPDSFNNLILAPVAGVPPVDPDEIDDTALLGYIIGTLSAYASARGFPEIAEDLKKVNIPER